MIGFALVLGVLLSSLVAIALDCPLDEGSAHRCVLAGLDLGGVLYSGFVLGWLAFLTWPGMLVSFALWIWVVVRRLRGRSRV